MASKESKWIKSERVGKVTLYSSKRSPYWQLYWLDAPRITTNGKSRPRERRQSTRETDLSLARMVASEKNRELHRRQHFPDEYKKNHRDNHHLRPTIEEFVMYLTEYGRGFEHVRHTSSRLKYLATWMEERDLSFVEDVTPGLLAVFQRHLIEDRGVSAATANDYIDAVHNFFGFVIYKRQLVTTANPASTGRQAALDRLPHVVVPPPTIFPDQINDIIRVARMHNDTQIVNLIVFACEGGFRFQELQFLQVGDIDVENREIRLDVKRPVPTMVRPELKRRCLTLDGYWVPKSRAGRRIVHITDRLLSVISTIGLGEQSQWVFVNTAGMQIAENKTLARLKGHALEAGVLVEPNPRTGRTGSAIRWHWLRHFHRTRAHASHIRRDVSKLAMGHAADPIHDHYRGMDPAVFHEEYGKYDSGIDLDLIATGSVIEESSTDRARGISLP